MKKVFITAVMVLFNLLAANAEADPNFHIYLCFGQSNMEGNAQWEQVDEAYVDPRFQMLATTDFQSPKRTMGNWYTANCPIVSNIGKLGMSDYFGRTLTAAMPPKVKVGVVAVAIGGCNILMFDKDKYQNYINIEKDWSSQIANSQYGNNPYKRLIDMAKEAQKSGVIKGILLHQGCSNNGDPNWPSMVKKIYNDILTDLGLKAEDVPLFAGETLRQEYGGGCYAHNTVVNQLPSVILTAHVIPSNGCQGNGVDPWHFCPASYRIMGKRYAYEVLKAMGKPTVMDINYKMDKSLSDLLSPTDKFEVKLAGKVRPHLQLWGTFEDGHKEDLTNEITFTSKDFTIVDNQITNTDIEEGVVSTAWTDFFGVKHTIDYNLNIADAGKTNLGEHLSGLTDLVGKTIAIVNEEEGKAFFGKDMQNLGYDVYEKAFNDANTGYKFTIEKGEGTNCYLFHMLQPNGNGYVVFGRPGYLNSQKLDQTCSFILGLNNQNGEDLKDGALWKLDYVEGKGYSFLNMGTGKYLKDAAQAKYDTPTYFSLCTLETSTAIKSVKDEKQLNNSEVYNLQGQKMSKGKLPAGIYIQNGKKFIIK